ncbi:NAD-dependent epimerase/dehydratase family protein [Flavobacterium sp. NPDC079362]|uniref:NAD-dependent epimerase/dehydratase family protein n=1 Tax=Flavobacterium sp. NPDC079362 TaxID=3390566 RepID=UPI003D03BB6E
MAKFLITGGSGFIGTNLITKLLNDNHQVVSIDSKEPKLKEHNKIYQKVNLCNREELESVILSYDPAYVIHLGARTDLNGKTLEDYDANIGGVENLLYVLDKLKNLKKVIFASSMYVCRPGYVPQDFNDFAPHTIYGESKVLTEKTITNWNPEYTWTIVRPTSIWGRYFDEPYNLFFKIVLSGKYFHMGSKACKKTYGYIDNFIYQLLSIITSEKDQVDQKIFYLGDYEPYDITSWADEIAATKSIKIHNVPYSVFVMTALFGDCLKLIRIKFPMTSFRLKNMTTDNFFDLSEIKKLAPHLPVSRSKGTKITVDWMVESNSL